MKKISVAIITKNEEANIRDCLESVRWADDIVVVDSGSTDQTLKICGE
ncbi:MAG: glycosyltransferase, partial [Deltaproteobacteria bacterium]|nr:glycosyltransferase [Deltaproteobacteria bacterium]